MLGSVAALVILLVALALILTGKTPSPVAPGSPSPTASPSRGAIAVPNVVNQKEGAAKDALKSVGLKVGPVQKVAGPDGVVVGTSPLVGQVVPVGTTVTLYVGSTPSPAPKPKKPHGHGKGKGD